MNTLEILAVALPILFVLVGKMFRQTAEIQRLKNSLADSTIQSDSMIRELNSEINMLRDEVGHYKMKAPISIPSGSVVTARMTSGLVLPPTPPMTFVDPIMYMTQHNNKPTAVEPPKDTTLVDWIQNKNDNTKDRVKS